MARMPDRENRQTVMMLVTEDCNLHCRYCFEEEKSPRSMNEELMKEIILRHIREKNDFSGVVFDMSGGEPLLVFNRIRRVIEWFHQHRWEKGHVFSIGSNATLLNEEMKAWFSSYKDCVVLCVSLDGTKRAHDFNRSNSYDRVVEHIPFIRENWPEQPVKMTINADTIDQVAEGIKNIHSLGLSVEANVVFEDVWGTVEEKEHILDEYARQLELLVEFYTENPHLTIPRIVNKYLPVVLETERESYQRYCGAGKYMVAYTPEGESYPCHRFTPLGSQRPCPAPYEAKRKTNIAPDKCRECLIKSICPTCQGFNWEEHQNVDYRTTYHCDFVKLEGLASAKLAFNKLKPKLLSLPLREIQKDKEALEMLLNLKAIKKVFSDLKT
jgi:radical SAM protein with 4Fe4S-binding SPASM domain